MECPKCGSVNSLNPVWIWAEFCFISMLGCRFCGSYFDKQWLENRQNFAIIRKQVEEHAKHIHSLKYR